MNKIVIPTIPVEVLQTLNLVSNDSRKIALLVFSEIMVTESTLCEVTKIPMSSKNLEPAFRKLLKFGIVDRLEDDGHVIWYTIHSKLLMEHMSCKSCHFRHKEVFRSPVNSAHYYTCNAPILCGYNYYRVAHAVLKRYKAEHGLSPVATDFRSARKSVVENVREYTGKDIEEWATKDFLEYILDKYKEYYPHIATPNRASIQKNFTIIKRAFIEEFDEWKYLVKHYITWNFQVASAEYKTVSMSRMTKPYHMQDYLEKHPFVNTVQECGVYGIKCPYWVDEGCKLVRQQSRCSKKIRSAMRRKYN